jgi:hypothetical protein
VTIEETFADLCAKHNLSTLSLSFAVLHGWSSYAHWDVPTIESRTCSSGTGKTANSALAAAIAEANAYRDFTPADFPQIMMEAA